MNDDHHSDLRVMLSDLRGEFREKMAQLTGSLDASSHRLRNVDMKVDSLANELHKCVSKEEFNERVRPLEKGQRIFGFGALFGVGAAGSFLWAFGKKLGLG